MAYRSISPVTKRCCPSVRKAVNDRLYDISRKYYRAIPISAIFEAARFIGEPLQEDGAPWQGFLCGREGRADIDLEGSKLALHFQWYRLESGNYEVNGYVS